MRRGFSLLELSMVLVVSGLMLSFVLQTNQTVDAKECYTATKMQEVAIRDAIDRFARKNDRLPLPAARNIGVENINYGRESSGANIDQTTAGATGVSFGAVPFQALGMPSSFAGDCWGNKFSYIVTTALTTNAASGGYLDSTVYGNINLKSAPAVTTNTTIAYAVISHGEDEYGAVKLNYSAANGTNTPPYAGHGWCSAASTLKSMNCRALANEVAASVFNNGKDAAANYFDDIVITGGKPQIMSNNTGNAYCWGANSGVGTTIGRVGDGTSIDRPNATAVTMPSATINFFSSIASGTYHSCALTITGAAYCWGRGGNGQLGNGGTTSSNVPVAVTMGGLSFTSISIADYTTCALATTNRVYCWGYDNNGQTGIGSYGTRTTPTIVPLASGVASYTYVSTSGSYMCAIANTGELYCTGFNQYSVLGLGDTTPRGSLTKVTRPAGVASWTSVTTSNDDHTCAIADTGDAYCWGRGTYGALGTNTTTDVGVPTNPVSKAVAIGVVNWWKKITVGLTITCGIADSDLAYCWGGDWSGQTNAGPGVLGNGTNGNSSIPVKVNLPTGVGTYATIQAQSDSTTVCALGNTMQLYCWGAGASNQLGNGGSANSNVPIVPNALTGALPLGSPGRGGRCALAPLPPASWGRNDSGQVGDGTTTNRPTPGYMKMPTGVNNFILLSDGFGGTHCGIASSGQLYCWGGNGSGAIGDGTKTFRSTPVPVTMPAGISAQSVVAGGTGSCAVGNDTKAYCWGSNYVTLGWAAAAAPALLTTLPSAFNFSIANYQAYAISGGQPYFIDNQHNMPYAATLLALPSGPTSVLAIGGTNIASACILGNDHAIYCKGPCDGNYDVIGNGCTSGTYATFTAVTPPTGNGFNNFQSMSIGDGGGGHLTGCALGDNGQLYCWGFGFTGMLGNGTTSTPNVPSIVTLPTGVTSWRAGTLTVAWGIVTAMGNDGNYYYWGALDDTSLTVTAFAPTKVPLPLGASGYYILKGRQGIVY